MSKLEFITVLALASDQIVYMVDVFLDNQLGYCFFTDMLQARVMSQRVQNMSLCLGYPPPWEISVAPYELFQEA